jgi:hypothetical protein
VIIEAAYSASYIGAGDNFRWNISGFKLRTVAPIIFNNSAIFDRSLGIIVARTGEIITQR